MKIKILISLLLLLCGMTLAYAQDMVAGTGIITAQGDGTVALNGSGLVTITGSGELFVVDRTHTATIDIESDRRLHHRERQTRGSTVHTYKRFDGTAIIEGDDIALIMHGINISVSVSGTGVLMFEGIGDYTLNEDTATWADEGTMISLNELQD